MSRPPVAAALQTRRATAADLDALVAHVSAGFASFLAFAPPGWRPPDVERERSRIAELLGDEQTWALLALLAGRPVGHVAFLPAREPPEAGREGFWRERPVIDGLAHLWQLFVAPDWWGRGVAPSLHQAAVTEMRARGFRHARLYTPTGHARARRFYERRGWTAVKDRFNDGLALTLTEYRLALDSPALDAPR